MSNETQEFDNNFTVAVGDRLEIIAPEDQLRVLNKAMVKITRALKPLSMSQRRGLIRIVANILDSTP